MIDTYDFFGGNGQVLSIVNEVAKWVEKPESYCDDGRVQRKKMYNCPNCGAPITGPRCAYCDTLLVEPTYYQYRVPYSGGGGAGARCNIRQQLEEALVQTAQNVQTNFILANNAIQSISLHSYESGIRMDRF